MPTLECSALQVLLELDERQLEAVLKRFAAIRQVPSRRRSG